VANKIEQIASLAKLVKEQQGKGGISFNPIKAWDEYSESVDNLFSGKGIKDSMAEAALEAAKLANQAKNAKAELVEINNTKVQVFSEEEANKLGTIEEYFDHIRDKIIDANKTPLQLIDAKVQQDAQSYFATLVQGGMSLDKMIELTENYKRQIEEAGGAGETAAEKIEKIGKSLKDAGGEEAKIKQLTGNLQELAKAANAKELEKANKQIISGLKKEWQSYADKVIAIQDKIADNQRTLASELRSIDQSNMTGMTLWKDKKREVEEYKASAIDAANKATAAFKAGDKTAGDKYSGLSEEYFKSAVAVAKQLNTEVLADTTALNNLVVAQERSVARLESMRTQKELLGADTSAYDAEIARQERVLQVYKSTQAGAEATVLQSKARSSEIAKQEITDVTNASVAAQKQMQDAQLDGMKKVQDQANAAAGGKEVDLTAGMDASKAKFIKEWLEAKDEVWEAMTKGAKDAGDKVTSDWEAVWDNWLDAGTDNIETLNSQLNELIKDRSMTISVKMAEARHLGGIIGGYASGGAIQAMANGGNVVKSMLSGGHLPGFGGGDRRLILGEDGEVMLNKFAVAKASPQTALAFNRGDFKTVVENLLTRYPSLLPGYVGGGMLSALPAITKQTTPVNSEGRYSASLTFTDTNGQRGVVVGSEIDIKLLERAINKTNRFRSSNK
jgi:hypothetical protein